MKRKSVLYLLLFVLAGVVGSLCWATYAQMQRNKLSPLLMQAVRQQNYNEVDSLLNSGVDPNSSWDDRQRSNFWSTLKRRFTRPHERINLTALMEAAGNHDFRMIQLLLDHGADVHVTAQGTTVLMWAATSMPPGGYSEAERVKCLRLLVDAGADVNTKNKYGLTALMWAAMAGHKDSAALLLSEGAKINAKDNTGRTAPMYASHFPEMVAFLKRAGAKE